MNMRLWFGAYRVVQKPSNSLSSSLSLWILGPGPPRSIDIGSQTSLTIRLLDTSLGQTLFD